MEHDKLFHNSHCYSLK